MLGRLSDTITPKYDLYKPFKVLILDRGAWKYVPPNSGDSMYYTDGSRMEGEVGASVYEANPRNNISVNLGS